MAHHHNHANHSSTTVPRPPLLRILALLALVVPALCYVITMSLTLATIYTPSFALSYLVTQDDGPITNITYVSSPFFACNGSINESLPSWRGFQQSCFHLSSRDALGASGMQKCREINGGTATQICAQTVLSAELFVTGAVTSGIAILFAVVCVGLGWRKAVAVERRVVWGAQAEREGLLEKVPKGAREEGDGSVEEGGRAGGVGEGADAENMNSTSSILLPVVVAFTTLLGIIAGVSLAIGQSVGANALVTLHRPTFIEDESVHTRWFLGNAGLIYPAVAYSFAAIGVLAALSGLGLKGR